MHNRTSDCRPAYVPKPSQLQPPTKKTKKSISALETNNFRPAQKTRQFRRLHWNQITSACTQCEVNLDPPHKKQAIFRNPHQNGVNFDTHTETKVISIPSLKSSQFRSPLRSISMPWHKNRVNFDPHTQNKSCSTDTPKPSQFRSLYSKQSKFSSSRLKPSQVQPYIKIKSSSIAHTEIKSTSTTHTRKQVYRSPYLKQEILGPQTKTKSMSIPHTKTMLL